MALIDPNLRLKNLFLVSDHRKSWKDFEEIGREILTIAKDVSVHIVPWQLDVRAVPPSVWTRPTITVSFGPLKGFVPMRGARFENRAVTKTAQYRRFIAAGVSTPRTEVFRFGAPYDPADWGDFVVLKPADLRLSSDKDNVRLVRTSYLSGMTPEQFADFKFPGGTALLVQSFVYTGPFPGHYRVLTLFGEPLYAQHRVNHERRIDLNAPDAEVVRAIVSDGVGECTRSYGDYPQVLAFARKTASAFPDHPLLGMDLIEDARTGQLSVLEVNAGGNTWHFSSPLFASRREKNPELLVSMKNQFGAFRKAAEVLVRQTRRYAS